MEQRPLAQGTGNNKVVTVLADHVEIKSGWQGQNVERLPLKDVVSVGIKGLVNCTLTIEANNGRVFTVTSMALPDARGIKAAVERQKKTAGLYE
jgi:hypothetical protein